MTAFTELDAQIGGDASDVENARDVSSATLSLPIRELGVI
jgi:hypothetical protein